MDAPNLSSRRFMNNAGKPCPLPTSHVTEPLHTGQTKARGADNGGSISKRRNAGMARVQGLPSGMPPGGHLTALQSLAMEQPLLQERALHMTTWRHAVARLVGKGQG